MVKWLLAAAGLIWPGLGADGMYQAMRDRTATTVTCSDRGRTRGPATILRVSGCEIDLSGVGYHGQPDALTEVYVLTRVPGSSAPARLLLRAAIPSTLSAAQAVLALTQTGRDGCSPGRRPFTIRGSASAGLDARRTRAVRRPSNAG